MYKDSKLQYTVQLEYVQCHVLGGYMYNKNMY